MQFQLEQAMDILARTPRTLRGLLGDIDEGWSHSNYGPDTFSPFDVVGHLVHGEKTDWIPRARLILDHADAKPFEPFDRYAMYEDSRGRSMNDLLDEFEQRRADNLRELAGLGIDANALARPGLHPDLGPVTMEALLATWVGHDLHHVAQICKAMAWQYREAYGPWRAYLGIVNR